MNADDHPERSLTSLDFGPTATAEPHDDIAGVLRRVGKLPATGVPMYRPVRSAMSRLEKNHQRRSRRRLVRVVALGLLLIAIISAVVVLLG